METARTLSPALTRDALDRAYRRTRALSVRLAAPLEPEDLVVQTMEDVSPGKWHLAHTTWFFEEMVLGALDPGHHAVDPGFRFLFNSYYESVGARVKRPRRGSLSRPTARQVSAYRKSVDAAVLNFIRDAPEPVYAKAAPLLELGLHHEKQHQELFLADIKHVLAENPSMPAYRPHEPARPAPACALNFRSFPGGTLEIGHAGEGFYFDNEAPRHRVHLEPFELASRCVTNRDYLAFIEDGGYRDFRHWLSDGWTQVQEHSWRYPLYWERIEGAWYERTLHGLRPLDPDAPVVHVSHFEADAYARWFQARLPTEAEWEAAAAKIEFPPDGGHQLDDDAGEREGLHPRPPLEPFGDFFGGVWEWTASAYLPYPGYRALTGALSEYNGKFMSGQIVLRGGSFATPRGHFRPSYRNFWQPEKRWQFNGFRLAR